jgi:phospholipase/carboxylesterase
MEHTPTTAVDDAIREQARALVHKVRPPKQKSQEPPPLLILLHGLGSNEHDLFGFAHALDSRLLVVSARAPVPLFPGGYGWFQIDFLPDGGLRMHTEQAEHSRLLLLAFLDHLLETYEADARRVYLAGFSQGAMMSMNVALTHPEKVAGVLAMSGRLLPEILPKMAAPEQLQDLPIMVTHGTFDDVLPIENGRATREILSRLPVALTYKEYPTAHGISPQNFTDILEWLQNQLTEKA